MNLFTTVLAGGSGTRFWPKSRTDTPKQFLILQGTRSLLQNTIERILPLLPSSHIQVVTASHQHQKTLQQLPELLPENILSEPIGRNTAAAVGLAAIHLIANDPEAIMVVLPADHVIPDSLAFCTTIRQAVEVVQQHNVLMTLGIHPTYPATGYGYIESGDSLTTPNVPTACQVTQFTEKPAADVAAHYVTSGRHYWNCGIFIWQAATILEEIATHLPDLWQGLQTYSAALQAGASADILYQHYAQLPNISIDYGVLERSSRVGVLPVTFAWSDVGSWRSLADLHAADENGNVVVGNHLSQDSTGLIVYSPNKLVATIGLTDLIIVQTDDALLICPKNRDQEVRDLVAALQQRGQTDYL
ncbi:MAG: mannose-1-phosphate guanylyltransferase [bacterium]|nr:mannose-1-phosphate guanylyltransferase [bacterium]